MSAYNRFPELLLEQPDAVESAFRVLLLSDVAVRDADEWEEHYMTSMASAGVGTGLEGAGITRLDSKGSDRSHGGGGAVFGAREGTHEKCRLAEIDGSSVAIIEVIWP